MKYVNRYDLVPKKKSPQVQSFSINVYPCEFVIKYTGVLSTRRSVPNNAKPIGRLFVISRKMAAVFWRVLGEDDPICEKV